MGAAETVVVVVAVSADVVVEETQEAVGEASRLGEAAVDSHAVAAVASLVEVAVVHREAAVDSAVVEDTESEPELAGRQENRRDSAINGHDLLACSKSLHLTSLRCS